MTPQMKKKIETIYREHQDILRRFIRSMTSIAEEDDILQDVLVRLMRNEQISEIENIRTYMFVVARNIIIDKARQAKRRPESRLDDKLESNILRQEASAEIVLLVNEDLSLLKQAVQKLPPLRRKIFVMSRLENRSYNEISEDLNMSVDALRHHVSRAVRDCKAYIDRKHNNDGQKYQYPGRYIAKK